MSSLSSSDVNVKSDGSDFSSPDAARNWQSRCPWPLVSLLIVGTIWYLLVYWFHPALPGNNPTWPLGWWGWSDQGQYWRSAQELSSFHLSREHYWYPLGYPLMGAVFFRLMPDHAFLIPDLLCFVGILSLFYRICREFMSSWEAVGLTVVAILLPKSIFTDSLVVPWSTTPAHLVIYSVIVLLIFNKPHFVNYAVSSLLLALMPWFRAGDMVYVLPVFVMHLWSEYCRDGLGRCGTKVALTVSLLALSVGSVAVLNAHVFGNVATPYMKVASITVGAGLEGLLKKAYSVFISAVSISASHEPMMIHRFPWLVLVPPGIYYLLKKYSIKHLGWIGAIAGCIGFYLSYNDFDAHNIFKYLTIRYWAWWLPLATLLAYLGLVKAWKTLTIRGVILTIAPCLLLVVAVGQMSIRCLSGDKRICAQCSGGGDASGGSGCSSRQLKLVLSEHRLLPVSKLTISGSYLTVEESLNLVVMQNGRPLKRFHEYAVDAAETGLHIIFRRDLPGDDPLVVELNLSPTVADKREFWLTPYYLKFCVGAGLFAPKISQWIEPLSLPPGRH